MTFVFFLDTRMAPTCSQNFTLEEIVWAPLNPICSGGGKFDPFFSYFIIASKIKKRFALMHPDFESNLITHIFRKFGVSRTTGSDVILPLSEAPNEFHAVLSTMHAYQQAYSIHCTAYSLSMKFKFIVSTFYSMICTKRYIGYLQSMKGRMRVKRDRQKSRLFSSGQHTLSFVFMIPENKICTNIRFKILSTAMPELDPKSSARIRSVFRCPQNRKRRSSSVRRILKRGGRNFT